MLGSRIFYDSYNSIHYVDPTGHFLQFIFAAIVVLAKAAAVGAAIGAGVGAVSSAIQGENIGKGALKGAAVGATFAAAATVTAAALPFVLGPAAAAGTLGQVATLGVAGSLSGGVDSSLHGGSFGRGAAIGGLVTVGTFGVARAASPIFNQLGEVIGPRLAQAGEAFTNSSAGRQLQKILARTGLGSPSAAGAALSEDTIPAGYRLLAPRGAANAPTTFTKEGEAFVRVGAHPSNLKYSFEHPGGMLPGTYAFPEEQFLKFQNNPLTIKYFGDLPGPAPTVYGRFRPPAGTPVKRGIVPGGQFGGAGGVEEALFPDGF